MKPAFILYGILFSWNVAAQPGDYGFSQRQFAALTEKLKTDPNNYPLIWERIELSRFNHTYFDMYTKRGNIKGTLSFFKSSTELLDDLNKLIDSNAVIADHNIAEFKMLRGRLYYLTGEKNKTLDDYLFAFQYNDSLVNRQLKDDVCVSLAAYYYNAEEKLTEENARKALMYIDMARPEAYNKNQVPDRFEREKTGLLKFLKEYGQLESYYKKLILSEYNSFVETRAGSFVTTDYLFNRNGFYFRTLKRVDDLAGFYTELKEYNKAKSISAQLLKLLPPGTNGKPYTIFPKEKIDSISSEQYSKRFFNLHYKDQYKALTWDYPDMSVFIKQITE